MVLNLEIEFMGLITKASKALRFTTSFSDISPSCLVDVRVDPIQFVQPCDLLGPLRGQNEMRSPSITILVSAVFRREIEMENLPLRGECILQ